MTTEQSNPVPGLSVKSPLLIFMEHLLSANAVVGTGDCTVSRTNKNSCLQRAWALRRYRQQTGKRANYTTRKNGLSVKKKIQQRRVSGVVWKQACLSEERGSHHPEKELEGSDGAG